jgi:hypothetical protein
MAAAKPTRCFELPLTSRSKCHETATNTKKPLINVDIDWNVVNNMDLCDKNPTRGEEVRKVHCMELMAGGPPPHKTF